MTKLEQQNELKQLMKLLKENPEAYVYRVIYFKSLEKMDIYFCGKAKNFTFKDYILSYENISQKYFLANDIISRIR